MSTREALIRHIEQEIAYFNHMATVAVSAGKRDMYLICMAHAEQELSAIQRQESVEAGMKELTDFAYKTVLDEALTVATTDERRVIGELLDVTRRAYDDDFYNETHTSLVEYCYEILDKHDYFTESVDLGYKE